MKTSQTFLATITLFFALSTAYASDQQPGLLAKFTVNDLNQTIQIPSETVASAEEEIDFEAALQELDSVPAPTLKQHLSLVLQILKIQAGMVKDGVIKHPVLTAVGVVGTASLITLVVYLIKHKQQT